MKDNEKQIEEMAKVIESTELDWYVKEGGSVQDWVKMHAEELYNAGYRQCKDKVVLTQSAYKSISSKAKANVVKAIEIRKETAREILTELYNREEMGFETIKWYAKEYWGVEIKE